MDLGNFVNGRFFVVEGNFDVRCFEGGFVGRRGEAIVGNIVARRARSGSGVGGSFRHCQQNSKKQWGDRVGPTGEFVLGR